MQEAEIHKDSLNIIYEMAWKYYEAEIARSNKIISKAQTYAGTLGVTFSFFSFASKDVILSTEKYGCYQGFLILIFVITIAYLLLAVISSLAAIKLTNVHKIGGEDIKMVAMRRSKIYEEKIKMICQKLTIENLVWYTKLNEQNDWALATYVGISQECYRKGLIGVVIFLFFIVVLK